MLIHKIAIKNYRSLKDISITSKNILSLVGKNNSGKSSIIKALKLFFDGSRREINDECFYNLHSKDPIKIFITFDQLNSEEKDQFKKWSINEKLTIGKIISRIAKGSYDTKYVYSKRVPKQEWLREDKISYRNVRDWWPQVDSLIINELSFSSYLGSSKPSVSLWKSAAKQFIDRNNDKIEWELIEMEISKRQSPSVFQSLPSFIYVPAILDIKDVINTFKCNPFSRVLADSAADIWLARHIPDWEERLKEIKRLERKYGEKEIINAVSENVNKKLNRIFSEILSCNIDIKLRFDEPKLIQAMRNRKYHPFYEQEIYIKDGVTTTLESQGQGLQRIFVISIILAYSELLEVRKKHRMRQPIIFAIEEPELYLHPHLQRTLMSVFRYLAELGDQVIYSTHSSFFVDITYFDEICIIRREKKNNNYESCSTQLSVLDMIEDLRARKGIIGSEEGIREQYSNVFDPIVNEGFFADKVVIVEGPSEQQSLPIYADLLGYDLNRNNISIIHSEGKGQMDRLLRIFNGFRIPTYIWFDGDKKGKKETKKKTLELLELLGDPTDNINSIKTKVTDKYAILEYNLELTLKDEIKDYETLANKCQKALGVCSKPIMAKFIANRLKEKIHDGNVPEQVLPKTIILIIGRLRRLKYKGRVLKK